MSSKLSISLIAKIWLLVAMVNLATLAFLGPDVYMQYEPGIIISNAILGLILYNLFMEKSNGEIKTSKSE